MPKLNHAQGDDQHVIWWCPGCREVHSIPVSGSKAWRWNGSSDTPTFSPSVLVYPHRKLAEDGTVFDTPRCHVFVTEGVIDFLSDCTHALAGQKVPMMDWRGYSAEHYADAAGSGFDG